MGYARAQSRIADCVACVGKDLVQGMQTISQKRECWFNPQHHYMVQFKDQMMGTIYEEFERLVKSANLEAPEKCKQDVVFTSCKDIADNEDDEAKCYIDQSLALAQLYSVQEECSKRILDPSQATFLLRFMSGVISGWQEIHTTC